MFPFPFNIKLSALLSLPLSLNAVGRSSQLYFVPCCLVKTFHNTPTWPLWALAKKTTMFFRSAPVLVLLVLQVFSFSSVQASCPNNGYPELNPKLQKYQDEAKVRFYPGRITVPGLELRTALIASHTKSFGLFLFSVALHVVIPHFGVMAVRSRLVS